MSTTFGVKVPDRFNEGEYEIVEVAFRSSYIRWIDTISQLLPDNMEVIALDNTAQGIYTIGDIREAIKEQEKL